MTQSILQHMHPDDLVPYYNNPRHNQDAVGPVAESIKAFGFKVPIVVDENLEVITGHTRLKAAKQLGLDRVRINPYCLRAVGPDVLHERARPAVRGRHHQTLGELDRRESSQAPRVA